MMGKLKKILATVLILLLSFGSVLSMPPRNDVKAAPEGEIRACWVSFLDIEYYLRGVNEETYRKRLNSMCNNMKNNLVNTVIFQVRPMGDAIYNSSIFPWSTYISYNRSNPGYDPLAIAIEVAHSKGLRFEAWINPFRLSNSTDSTEKYKKTDFYKKNKSNIIEYDNGDGEKRLSLDPSKDKARQIIVDGVCEIVKNYDVDGIHFDDYFYVAGLKQELSTDSKMNHVNQLVKKVYSSIKKIDENCVFGISPEGNIDNCYGQGLDLNTWLSNEGYVDYIMPQIYWTDNYISSYSGKNITMYSDRCKEWKELNKIGIPMYVGFALYRCGIESSTDVGWGKKNTNLAEQYMILKNLGYKGYSLFRYAWLDCGIVNANNNNGILTGDSTKDEKIKKYTGAELENLRNIVSNSGGNSNDGYVIYSTHIQSIGWQGAKNDGVLSGTTGLKKRMEGIKILLGNKAGNGSIEYRTHCQSYGWLPWVSNGKMSGTEGESKRMEAIQIRLSGEVKEKYDVYYRVHVQSFGWLDWAKNGEAAGSATYGKRLEAIQIQLKEKNQAAPGKTDVPYRTRKVAYNCHVQTYGWLDKSFDGDSSGTTKEAKRLEAIKISIPDNLYEGDILYRTHCQSYGWLPWVSNGQVSGTSGERKRLEAIQIKLSGRISEEYDVYYRVHCQTYGWLPWVANGEVAGTEGESKRLEAIQIQIVKKGTSPN